jgi:multiple sugar transport system permease protein
MKPIAGGRGEAGQVAARLAVAPALPRTRPTTRLLEDERVLGWVLLLPTIVLLALFIAYPFVSGVWLSLTSATVGVPGIFVGLKNFAKVWNDTIFQRAAYNTFVYTGIATVGKLGLGMWLALLLNRHFKGKRLVRASMLLPFIVPTVLSTFAWKWMFDPTFSVLNWSLYHLGVIQARIGWLTDPTMALGSIIIVNIWRGMPFYAISLLAGLQTVSPELHEAAAIDGARPFTRFRTITLPLLSPASLFLVVWLTINALQLFDEVYLTTRGGPLHATTVIVYYLWDQAFVQFNAGYAAAMAYVLFLVIVVFTAIQFRLARKYVHYS